MKLISYAVLVILSGIIFYRYGRSIYRPIIQQIKGKESIESVINKIESKAYTRIASSLDKIGYTEGYPDSLVLVALKEEKLLEVYAVKGDSAHYLKEYPFTAYSGTLGPKLKEGDKQIPEGIYDLEYLNPNSAFYLSIKVGYPNAFDIDKSTYSNIQNMGGDIFIHGKAASIGCIAIGDQAIEEVFLLTYKIGIENIKIIISPKDFRTNTDFPIIHNVDWSSELYQHISAKMSKIPTKTQ